MRSGRPERGEYADYAQEDFDFIDGDDAIEALERSRDATIALFRRAPWQSRTLPVNGPSKKSSAT